MNQKKKVSVLGLGYVGLPLLLAIGKSKKYNLVGFDLDSRKIEAILNGKFKADADGDIDFEQITITNDERKIKDSDFFIICVPTPVSDNFLPDYSFVTGATEIVSKYLKKGSTVILESTVNPGTCEEILLPILEKSGFGSVEGFNLAMCPERINPGDPKWNVNNIPRNIGSLDEKKVEEVAQFYESFLEAPINRVSSLKVAEATKIVENTFRDINIAYVNELAKSFDVMEIDLYETLTGASNKPFSFMPHWPGRGVGGHCIAVDPYYLIRRAAESGFDHKFLKLAREINNSMPAYTVSRLQDALNQLGKPIKGNKITLLGLSYKSNIADLRESPCLKILELLEQMGAKVKVFDPFVLEKSDVKNLDSALSGADAVILGTYHDIFGDLTSEILEHKNIKVVVDGVNKLDKNKLLKNKIIYKGIGR